MYPHSYTPVPNIVLDRYLCILKPVELAVLLVIIRQTVGWVEKGTDRRKRLDWLSGSQLRARTGYSRKAISTAIDSLATQGLVQVFDGSRRELRTAAERKGKTRLYFGFCLPVESGGFSPPVYKGRAASVENAHHLRTFYAEQRKLLQKKMTMH